MKKNIIAVVFSALVLTVSVKAQTHSVDGFNYEIRDGYAILQSAEKPYPSGRIYVPEEITIDESTYAVAELGVESMNWAGAEDIIILPNTIKRIGDFAFHSTNTSVELPFSIQTIGDNGLSFTYLNAEITLPNICCLGPMAFSNTNVRSVKIGSGLRLLCGHVFSRSEISEIIFEDVSGRDEELTISNFGFSGIKNAKELKLPNRIMRLGDCMITSSDFERVVFPDVKELVYGCNVAYLSYDLMVDIEGCWIKDCPNLKEIVCLGNVPPEVTNLESLKPMPDNTIKTDKFRVTDNVEECVLKVPAGSEELYRAHPVWGDFKTITGFENGDYTSIAVPEMTDAALCAPEYYNLQGIKVASPVRGQMYIRVLGTQSDKIVY